MFVDNTLADPMVKIINCDIGVNTENANFDIANSDIENTLLGIMGKSTGNVNYRREKMSAPRYLVRI